MKYGAVHLVTASFVQIFVLQKKRSFYKNSFSRNAPFDEGINSSDGIFFYNTTEQDIKKRHGRFGALARNTRPQRVLLCQECVSVICNLYLREPNALTCAWLREPTCKSPFSASGLWLRASDVFATG